VDNPSSREQRRVPQQTTTQVTMHPAPVQRAGPSVPASDLGPSPGLRSPENLSAPYPPAPPIRHSSDSLPAGKPVRWVGRETGSASTPRPRATSRRADPAVAPVSASAMPLGAPVRQEGRRRHPPPSHYSIHPPGLHQPNPQRNSDGWRLQDARRTAPEVTVPVEPVHFAPMRPMPPQHPPLRAAPAQQADLVIQPQCAQTPKARRKAGSTFLKSLLLPFKICFFIIHVFVLTIGLMTIIGASGVWWVANHQKEANEMAAATLEYMDKNKDRLKPATDLMGHVFDALLPSKIRPGPVEPEGPPSAPLR
jgi:hypothetical protein